MKISEISSDINDWFKGGGSEHNIIISSRIRLARNLAGFKFLSSCSPQERSVILDLLKEAVMTLNFGDETSYVSIDKSPRLDRELLVERHLISRQHAFGKGVRGAVIVRHEFFTAMFNEEDHLRMQVIKNGMQLENCWQQLNKIDDEISRKIEYAFSPKLGYLTACPTNVGTGIRVSVMLHLPALKMTRQIKKLLNAAKAMNLAVRGLFGEGTDAEGDFYQLSNQATLGVSEEQIITKFQNIIVPQVVEYELAARKRLLESEPELLNDKIYRAMALLKNAHLISSHEALTLLSHLRMGINLEKVKNISIDEVNRLFMLTQPAHLQINCGEKLDPDKRDTLRAQIIRSALQN